MKPTKYIKEHLVIRACSDNNGWIESQSLTALLLYDILIELRNIKNRLEYHTKAYQEYDRILQIWKWKLVEEEQKENEIRRIRRRNKTAR